MLRHFKAEFFKTLAHASRIRILDALREGELTVGELQHKLEMEQSNVSQHLSILRLRDFVHSRREGTSVYYSLADPAVWQLLDIARDVYERQLHSNKANFEALATNNP